MPAPVRYIENKQDLQEVVKACLEQKVISIDTEFARFNTYYPIVGLIQIYDGQTCCLIDPLVVDDLSPLIELLVADDVLKVFHACSEDMEVFQYCLDTSPAPVFDSQIAAAALGIGFSISYQNLVTHYLSVTVPKEETRSDWLQRPLTDGQIKYAALDVIYLLQVYEKQRDQLRQMQREEWVLEDCELLSVDLGTMIEPDSAYKKLKGLARLNRKQLSVLKALCAWREIRAREDNVPRNRIVEQKSLMMIASQDITDKQALRTVAGMFPRQVRKFGEDLMFLAEEAKCLPESQYPQLVPKDGARIDAKQLSRLREVVQVRATSLAVTPELLSKRRHLEALLRSSDGNGNYELPEGLLGWRKEVIGNDLLEALR